MNKNSKYLSQAILLLLVALLLIAIYKTSNAESMTCTVPKGQYVNVRDRASLYASGLGKLHNGDVVEIEEFNDGWIKFYMGYEQQMGYVSSKYFEIPADEYCIVTANGRVRYRDSINGASLGFYDVGEVIHVDAYGRANNGDLWARNGDKYVMSEFLKVQSAEVTDAE